MQRNRTTWFSFSCKGRGSFKNAVKVCVLSTFFEHDSRGKAFVREKSIISNDVTHLYENEKHCSILYALKW